MGTKNRPGKYDCYAKLGPDEPYLTLRGKDPSARYLVLIWLRVRLGDFSGAADILDYMSADPDVLARISTEEHDKLAESRSIASAMMD